MPYFLSQLKSTIFKASADGLSREFKRSCDKLSLENLRFHDLRHEATSRLIEMGLNPIEAAVAGHMTLQILKRCTHLKSTDLAKTGVAINLLNCSYKSLGSAHI